VSYSGSILPEFDQEMAGTRKVLERVPEEKLDWQPHPKSHTIGWNANHLAELPAWAVMTLRESSLDMNPPGGQSYRTPKLTTLQEILEAFDRNVAEARAALKAVTDEEIMQPWSLLNAGETIFTMPRAAVIRSFVINHIIHHRAILCVYYRMNEIPVPGLYGPSGDE
jgi:uncharacterized damage-inducible protein DinB